MPSTITPQSSKQAGGGGPSRSYSVIIHQITAPRTAQFLIVVVFTAVVAGLAMTDRSIPEFVGLVLSTVVGYYFGNENRDSSITPPNGQTADGVARYVDGEINAGHAMPRSVALDQRWDPIQVRRMVMRPHLDDVFDAQAGPDDRSWLDENDSDDDDKADPPKEAIPTI